ncbi:hypothetical protein E2C01_062933 [Portunus trituberculatus]|uniref:Uncharacterized protein n=1 Tax=Portunus trituberculatus TaxID=210409 RepID=A0A5B7HHF5_PORTR|nr:hypothetical protein [Portunus trituberculatus]
MVQEVRMRLPVFPSGNGVLYPNLAGGAPVGDGVALRQCLWILTDYFKITLFCTHVHCEALFSRDVTQVCSGETPGTGGMVGGRGVWALPGSLDVRL